MGFSHKSFKITFERESHRHCVNRREGFAIWFGAWCREIQPIQRPLHPAADLQNVGVNHRRFNVRVPEQLLHRANVRTALQQMCGLLPVWSRHPRATLWSARGGMSVGKRDAVA